MWPINKRAREGFTLVELLVSIMLTTVVLGAVALVFASTTRTVKRGYNNMKGFERIRGAFDILEKDLTTAFTAREHGDNYKFFGTPIGMMFVGMANNSTRFNSDENINLTRISYVLYVGDPARHGAIAPGSAQSLADNAGSRRFQMEEGAGPDARLEDEMIVTYSLLRYVENGISDLDSYPAPRGADLFADLAQVGGETGPSAVRAEYLRFLLDRACCPDGDYPDVGPASATRGLALDAAKRELWLRMLGGDPNLPDLWGRLGKSPQDYVVTDSLYLPWGVYPLIPQPLEAAKAPFPVFQYGRSLPQRLAAGNEYGSPEVWAPYWNSLYNIDVNEGTNSRDYIGDGDLRAELLEPNAPPFEGAEEFFNSETLSERLWGLGTPLDPRLPELIKMQIDVRLASPFASVPEFERAYTQVVDVPTGYARGKGRS